MVAKYLLDIPWRLFGDRYDRRLATGCAGVARLRLSMQERDMPLWLNSPMKSLLTDEQGVVMGALVERDGKTLRVRARKAVVLAAGGFEHNQEMREQYLPKPTNRHWSAAVQENTGDAIKGRVTALRTQAHARFGMVGKYHFGPWREHSAPEYHGEILPRLHRGQPCRRTFQ